MIVTALYTKITALKSTSEKTTSHSDTDYRSKLAQRPNARWIPSPKSRQFCSSSCSLSDSSEGFWSDRARFFVWRSKLRTEWRNWRCVAFPIQNQSASHLTGGRRIPSCLSSACIYPLAQKWLQLRTDRKLRFKRKQIWAELYGANFIYNFSFLRQYLINGIMKAEMWSFIVELIFSREFSP